MTKISRADLDPTGHTSFSFYDFLPGQGFEVAGAPPLAQAVPLADKLLGSDLLTVGVDALDDFTALLLTHGYRLPAVRRFERLADSTARAFAALIGNDPQRPRRMRLTRLSLMLRIVLDRGQDASLVIEESMLACKSPWDLLDGWAVTCDHDNVRKMKGDRVIWSERLGLPTQLDALGDALWVGSHYTAGGYIVHHRASPPRAELVSHAAPLVLVFDFDGARYALDSMGALWEVNGVKIGARLLQLTGRVHRARVIGTMLYAFDWSQAGLGFAIDLQTCHVKSFDTAPVIVCNDVCGDTDVLYAICKLQGRVFKVGRNSKRSTSRLGAGVNAGQLLDPIMVRRNADGTLSVLNWFSSKLVRLKAF